MPYTIYTTGIAWRKDHVSGDPGSMANGYQFPGRASTRGRSPYSMITQADGDAAPHGNVGVRSAGSGEHRASHLGQHRRRIEPDDLPKEGEEADRPQPSAVPASARRQVDTGQRPVGVRVAHDGPEFADRRHEGRHRFSQVASELTARHPFRDHEFHQMPISASMPLPNRV